MRNLTNVPHYYRWTIVPWGDYVYGEQWVLLVFMVQNTYAGLKRPDRTTRRLTSKTSHSHWTTHAEANESIVPEQGSGSGAGEL